MKHTVLLVDDDPNLLSGLTRALRGEPYQMVTANTAAEALEFLATSRIDVVISDEGMPGMTGTEFLAEVARDYPAVVKLMLTGKVTPNVWSRAIERAEVYRFFSKPCDPVTLAVTIRQVLREKESTINLRVRNEDKRDGSNEEDPLC